MSNLKCMFPVPTCCAPAVWNNAIIRVTVGTCRQNLRGSFTMLVKTQFIGRSTPSNRRPVSCNANSGSHNESFRPLQRRAVMGGMTAALISVPMTSRAAQLQVERSDEEWQQFLGKDAYRVLRKKGTERPYSSPLDSEKRQGTFACAGCGQALFSSAAKFNSGTGWPSFYQPLPGAVDEELDLSIPFMARTEIHCRNCKGHLGHVFNDGPRPTGLRYCMNGVAMKFLPESV
ncbi:hypothetical protein CEUSTIGMA_g6039.t1 [Chlamydomonas eustigma]|uniref:Peptide-methionine (R)-S-oxide reductase n=1 Tax=Chlamydomonas eustigma TaxID=1157962 RepID=A0A250X766_9CHLO|nr:hypothetical protein CEUSTIGMA_g6039.t1 [Chlamydomonas eustigma]|eukprot:GAX78600.1 hypothetical protein CEUSTIGMA_g6039.t1 [Chlamydomonas eustigma]